MEGQRQARVCLARSQLPGESLKLPVQVWLGAGLGFEVRSKAKTVSDGSLGRTRGVKISPTSPRKDTPRAEPDTW
jgi:hypothetical protein